jgi:DNA polymerase I-like protein with 3'-5' exonuclease and polymerase domains
VVGRGHIVGIAVAVEGWSGYFPIHHEQGGNLDRSLVLGWLQEILKQENTTFIFHNAMYDVCWLRSAGITIKGKIVDTMIAASLIDENRMSYQLNALAKHYVGIGKDENVLNAAAKEYGLDPKKDMWRLPALFVGQYAERDAEATLKLWKRLESEMYREELWDVFNLETKLFPCLVDMRFKGVRVDIEKANLIKKDLIKREIKIINKIKELTGVEVEIHAARSIAKAFDKLKLLQNLEGVDEIVEAYNKGDADFHQVVADMAGIERKQAKTINLGLMYGMGKNKLMSELGLMKESAEKLIKQYHTKAPFVKKLMDNVTRKAEDRGKIRTLCGRACHFDLWQPIQFGVYKPLPLELAKKEYDEPLKRAFTYKALNKLIQGSAADMTKKSMVALYENGFIPHIQIHDEIDISVESDKHAEQIIEIMESAVELKVPNKVDYEKGINWGDIK